MNECSRRLTKTFRTVRANQRAPMPNLPRADGTAASQSKQSDPIVRTTQKHEGWSTHPLLTPTANPHDLLNVFFSDSINLIRYFDFGAAI